MSALPKVEKATFRELPKGKPFAVHFNPQSLQYTITNNLKNTGSGNSAKQYVDKSTGKLSLDLVFDTTDSGKDVRLDTLRVARLMEPTGSGKVPPKVEFSWGLYGFVGMVQSYKETLDFFSADGVPLRATINLSLSSQDKVFERGMGRGARNGAAAEQQREGAIETPAPDEKGGRGVADTAARAGDPALARRIAADNGIERPRFPGRRKLVLDDAARPAAPSGLAAPAGARGAFAGLREAQAPTPARAIDTRRLQPDAGTAAAETLDPTDLDAAGKSRQRGSGGLGTDVGKAGELRRRLQFKEPE